MTITIKTAIGARGWREGLERQQSQALAFDFVDVTPIHRAFGPMAREQKFDLSEMAIVTALQALAYRKPLLLLPVTVAARFQHRCLIRRGDKPFQPQDLKGRKIGVRAYTQTTGMWLRGILQNDYGVAPDQVTWVTQEGAHVTEYRDPDCVKPAPAGRSLIDLLRAGDIDAAILGNDLPDDPDLAPVIPDPQRAAKAWHEKHGIIPINHMMMVTKAFAQQHREALPSLWQAIRAAEPPATSSPRMTAIGIEANRRGLETVLQFCMQQNLLPRPMSVDDIFADTVSAFGADLLE